MKIRPLFSLLLLLAGVSASAQSGNLAKKDAKAMEEAEDLMAGMVATMYTDSSEEARFTACRDLIKTLVATLNRPNSFSYEFTQLKGLSIKYPEDRSFRLFTWELNIDRDTYRHYGAIQKNTKDLELTPLVDRGEQLQENPEMVTLGPDRWLGYAAYKLMKGGELSGQPYYFIFGYDSYESYRRRKVLDVLSFDPTGKATFGLPVFATYNDAGLLLTDRKRIILEYGAAGVVALNFDPELGGVIYENLVMMPGQNDEGPVSMPDGSYHALKLGEDGMWREEERVFDHKYEEAPREAAKPDGGRDLLGRSNGEKPEGGN